MVALAVALALVGCSGAGDDVDADRTTTSTTSPGSALLAAGTRFAMVTVGEDETGVVTLGVDLAELLSGEEAKRAAVEDGFIAEDEDLPNDFYIDNDDQVLELVHVADNASFILISGSDTAQQVAVDTTVLVEIWEGSYAGEPIYAAGPGIPIPMEVTISDGLIAEATQVYLP